MAEWLSRHSLADEVLPVLVAAGAPATAPASDLTFLTDGQIRKLDLSESTKLKLRIAIQVGL